VAFIDINPCYRHWFDASGLTTPDAILGLPALIISGHPDRNVARVRIGSQSRYLKAFLKREHRVPWKERLVNAWNGYGYVSKSQREAIILRALRTAGIRCPDWLANGEDDSGQAFVLICEIDNAIDLTGYLRDRTRATLEECRLFARDLGRAVAHLHNGGFNHGDLYSKHVFVDPGTSSVQFIDWQRARRHRSVPWRLRCRDLATLDATLESSLVRPAEWRAFLSAYLSDCRLVRSGRALTFAAFARDIIRYKRSLLRDRKIRDTQRLNPVAQPQNVIWRQGEALCVTEEFDSIFGTHTPDWLKYDRMPRACRNLESTTHVRLPGGPSAKLILRRETLWLNWITAWIRGKKLVSACVRQAGLILRNQRFGLATPRLLAFGQRQTSPWCVESFILTGLVDSGPHFAAHNRLLTQQLRLSSRSTARSDTACSPSEVPI
jgi:tRNA A-37 threonylcarbamoyl transferase component Bud32